jgi:hypothetical protein
VAHGFVEHEAASTSDGDHGARELTGVDLGAQRGENVGEAGGGHADGLRVGGLKWVGGLG